MEKNNILYSIIVPVYNSDIYINRCIESILNQTYNNFEIIIIDDGSTDNTGVLCTKMSKQNNKIKYIYQENSGVSKARNRGILESKGQYITFIDADDYIEKNTLESINDILATNDIDIIKYSYYKETKLFRKMYKFSIDTNRIIHKIDYKTSIYPYILSTYDLSNVWNAFYKRNIITGNLFDESLKYAEDFKFMCDCLKKSQSIYLINKPLYHYVYNKNSAINSHMEEKVVKKYRDNIVAIYYISKLFGIDNRYIELKKIELLNDVLIEMNLMKYPDYCRVLSNLNKNDLLDDMIYSNYKNKSMYYKNKIRTLKWKLRKFAINVTEK